MTSHLDGDQKLKKAEHLSEISANTASQIPAIVVQMDTYSQILYIYQLSVIVCLFTPKRTKGDKENGI